jgi:thiol peroxidase
MKTDKFEAVISGFLLLLVTGCASTGGVSLPIDTASSAPGTAVTLKGDTQRLTGTPLQVGSPLPATTLVDAFSMKKTDLSQMKGKVLFLSVVPSLDTKVCEAQTHILGERGAKLSPGIARITISRDTPVCAKRFAEKRSSPALPTFPTIGTDHSAVPRVFCRQRACSSPGQ